jgi:hypothetical protein
MKQEEFDETGWDGSLSPNDSGYPPLDEETMAQIADEAFLEYDIREAESEHRAGVAHQSASAIEESNHHE